MNNFLVETVWVMVAYGARPLALGLTASLAIVIWASRCSRFSLRTALLIAAILPLWTAMFVAADSGYRAWQSTPNPPDEAFSDTGPIFFLLAGWLPSFGIVYLLLRLCQRAFPHLPASLPCRRSGSN